MPEPTIIDKSGLGGTQEQPFIVSAAPAQDTEKPTHIVEFCNWTSPTYGSQGELGWNVAFKAAQLAIAIANSVAQQEIADKQLDLADKWFSHQKYKWTRFQNNFLPLEKQLMSEVAYRKMPTLDCDSAIARAEEQVRNTQPMVDDWLGRQFKSYRICAHDSSIRSIEINNSIVQVDCHNFNLSDDRWFRDYKEDQRWNNRSNVLNLGRNMDSQAQTYGDLAGRIFGQVGQQIGRFGQSAMTALGYFGTRNEGFVPTSYLSTGGHSNTVLSSIQEMQTPLGTSGLNVASHYASPGGLGG